MPCDMALQIVLDTLPGQIIGLLFLGGVLATNNQTLHYPSLHHTQYVRKGIALSKESEN